MEKYTLKLTWVVCYGFPWKSSFILLQQIFLCISKEGNKPLFEQDKWKFYNENTGTERSKQFTWCKSRYQVKEKERKGSWKLLPEENLSKWAQSVAFSLLAAWRKGGIVVDCGVLLSWLSRGGRYFTSGRTNVSLLLTPGRIWYRSLYVRLF